MLLLTHQAGTSSCHQSLTSRSETANGKHKKKHFNIPPDQGHAEELNEPDGHVGGERHHVPPPSHRQRGLTEAWSHLTPPEQEDLDVAERNKERPEMKYCAENRKKEHGNLSFILCKPIE